MDIVLCATQRCGSTLIVEDMRNTEVLGQPKEWFLSWLRPVKEADWSKSLQDVYAKATGKNDVSAIKIMTDQLFAVEKRLATFVQCDGVGDFPHFHETFKSAQWVFLTRSNVVGQAVSRVMARQTGINHATGKAEDQHFAGNLAKGYDPNYNAKAVYRYGAILEQVSAISLANLAWERFFASHNIEPLRIVYEDAIQDENMSYLDSMADMMGLSEKLNRTPRVMVKIGNERNKEWVERFFVDAAKHHYKRPVIKKTTNAPEKASKS